MQKLKRQLAACFGTMALLGAVALLAPSGIKGQGGGPPARDVNVSNQPTVDARQAGEWGVSVNSSPANPVSVRDVDRQAREPFQEQAFVTYEEGGIFQFADLYVVPAGKRLVIEYVSFGSSLHPGQALNSFAIHARLGAKEVTHVVPLTAGTDFGSPRYVASHAVKMYADPGTKVRAAFSRDFTANPSTGGTGALISLTGYLEAAE